MNATLTIARRELAEKQFVFIGAASLAVLIFIMPFVPGAPAKGAREVLVVASAVLGSAFALGLASILGATIVGRELTERRMSFYFSKPIPAPAIWAGKLIAAAVLVATTFLIVSAPGLAAGAAAIRRVWSGEGRDYFALLAVLTTGAFFIAHILATVARARSAWAALDLVAFATLAFVAWLVVRPLVDARAMGMLTIVVELSMWLLLIVVIFAGGWQLAVGRTDRQRSHQAMSRFLWPAAAGVVAIAGLIVAWVVFATPSDLADSIHVYRPARSDYAIVSGETKNRSDYRPAFLMHLATGEFERLGSSSPFFGIEFAEGGRKLLVMRPIDRITGTAQVFLRDLAKGSREEDTGLTMNRWRGEIATTTDAHRIAYLSENVVNVYDRDAKHSLGSIRVPEKEYVRAIWFATPDVLRIHTVTGGPSSRTAPTVRAAKIYEYDVRTRAFRKTGEHHQMSIAFVITALSPDRSKLIIRTPEGSVIADAATAAPLVTIPGIARASILTDGRIVGFEGSTLRVFTASGAPQRAIDFSPQDRLFVREIASGRVLVGGLNPQDGGARWRVMLVDINTGTIVRSEFLQPMFEIHYREPMSADQLYWDANRNVVRWNALTNEKKVLIRALS